MTDQPLPFGLEYGQGLKHLGIEARPHSSINDYDRQVRDMIKRGNLTHLIYSRGNRTGPNYWVMDDVVAYQKQLMEEILIRQELLGKYFTGGEYNGRTELLLPSTQGDLRRRARG